MTEDNGKKNGTAIKTMLVIIAIFMSVVTAAFVYAGNIINDNRKESLTRHELIVMKLQDLNTRVVVIESNRFTAKDGHEMMKAIEEKFPPQWLVDDMNEIKELIKNRRLHDSRLNINLNRSYHRKCFFHCVFCIHRE